MASDTSQSSTVTLQLLEGVADTVATGAQAILGEAGIELRTVRPAPKRHAGLALYQPTAAVLLVNADLFHDFLAMAGSSAYDALTRAASAVWQQCLTATLTSGQTYSPAYSIVGQYAPGLNFKLLFKVGINAEAAETGISAFLHLIDDLLSDRVPEAECTALLAYLPVGGIVLVTYDAQAGKIVPVNATDGANSGS